MKRREPAQIRRLMLIIDIEDPDSTNADEEGRQIIEDYWQEWAGVRAPVRFFSAAWMDDEG